jgi:hypothetical protein
VSPSSRRLAAASIRAVSRDDLGMSALLIGHLTGPPEVRVFRPTATSEQDNARGTVSQPSFPEEAYYLQRTRFESIAEWELRPAAD